ncbi:hypothetical protein DXG03_001139 [Asterophora parasitica]|uniref:Histone H1 n=1 Tax=Asterophora parasitica TaxID=117018 RepID=A0A9P7GD59_9AGAR|nr:hypothetical protein DXG03_001139 [Asterophora parasitica]
MLLPRILSTHIHTIFLDHELKKQYLALLPPQQIIDICLNFDLHVPPYVKSSIWPADINAAIAAMRKASPPPTEAPAAPVASTSTSTDGTTPAMGSLATSSDPSTAADKSIEQPTEAQPPDKPPTPDLSASAQTSVQPSPAPEQPPAAAPAPVPPQPPYPHQPYGYGHPQAAYPHAPYYQPPPGYPPYPSPYPYPQMPTTYPPPPHPAYPQPLTSPFTTAPLTHPPQPTPDAFNPNPNPTEDLPSYEEMIAEALLDSGDLEGCAPKDLFTWMASRYPLQQNFRPSASQALQKAFKRGRFQKSSGGKYRLNATWEGGNTSRRTTRRPQTQNPPAPAPAPASPFTHAPLVHHHQQPAAQPGFQAPGFNYTFQQQGYPGFQRQTPAQQQAQPATAATGTSAAVSAAATTDDAGQPPAADGPAHDAWEAAQNILKAINFDSLLQLPKEDDKATAEQDKAPAAGPSTATPSAPVASASDVDFLTAALSGGDAAHAGTGTTGTEVLNDNVAAGRAELQAQLALLAAQLAELSQEDEDDPVVHYPVVGPPASAPAPAPAPVPAPPVSHVPHPFMPYPPVVVGYNPVPPSQVPMGSLPPDVGFALPGPAATVVQPPLQAPPPPPPHIVPPSVTAEQEEEEDSEDDDDMEEVI